MKTKSINKLKKEVWDLFSQVLRMEAADWKGYAHCVTCGKYDHYKRLQAGHFVPGRHNSVLFDTRNVHVQCVRCNVMLKGNLITYWPFMLKTYGQKVINTLIILDRTEKRWTREELEKMKLDLKKKKDKLKVPNE